MGKDTKDLLNATVNLYRVASGDETSAPEEIAVKFANEQITTPLVHHSRISGKMISHGSILPGRFAQKRVEEILAEPQHKGNDVLHRRDS